MGLLNNEDFEEMTESDQEIYEADWDPEEYEYRLERRSE